LIVVGLAPAARPIIAPLGFAINVIYVVAGAISLWLCRQEQLPARWPLIGLLVVHAVVVASGVHFTLHLAEALDQVPPLMSLFGMIHFESIVFSIGTAAFLMALVIERREAATKVAATTDPLTGIANRAAFVKVAGRVLERCRQDGAPVSMIMFDLDRFKSVNDTFGHATGDAVIQKFCAVAAAALRPTDLFGRIGGEEFAVIMPRSSIEAAYIRADRIRASFAEQCRTVGSNAVKATVSGGVAASANAGLSLSDLLEYSDQALYSAKASGRNRVKLAEPKAVLGEGVPAVIRVA
jgi:diguanylate cyclase (GGDEF)-like protein